MHANLLMCLLKYVYHDKDKPQPRWYESANATLEDSMLQNQSLKVFLLFSRIRATYTTNAQKLNPAFLVKADTAKPPEPTRSDPKVMPNIINVFPDTFAPSFTEHHLERIDALLARSNSWKIPPLAVRNSVKGRGEKLETKEKMYMPGREKIDRECGRCRKVGSNMQTCGRCKTVSSNFPYTWTGRAQQR